MKRMLPYLVTLSLGLWLGGLAALILFVSTLFVKARGVAGEAATVLFHTFEKYQLVLAAVALLSLVVWRWTGRSRTKTLTLAAVLMATLLAVVQIALITPRIERYRDVDRPAFDRYHRLASANYTTTGAFVLAAFVLATTA
ncbi:MAG TPA: DUF4149 domain-containing protein, partial [Tepidisphaeraceae bacterium]